MVAQFPSTGEHYGLLFAKGNPLVACVNKALATLKGNGTLAKLTTKYLKDLHQRPDHPALGGGAAPPAGFLTCRPGGPGCWATAAAGGAGRCPPRARVVVLAALVAIFLLAPGSAQVRHTFFNPADMWQSFVGDPKAGYYSVGEALWLNIRMFVAAEVLILIVALVVALIRQSTGPVLLPLRVVATVYVDFFRGVPLILIIFAIGFGVPALQLAVISDQSAAVYGVAALVLSYSAYVSEVYRAGINSVHRSQVAAARSLGLSQCASMRYVILPQAMREHHPAAAERLHQPAEGHRAGRRARRDRGEQGRGDLQLHRVQLLQLRGGGDLVPAPDHPAGPVHRPPDRP